MYYIDGKGYNLKLKQQKLFNQSYKVQVTPLLLLQKCNAMIDNENG